jgi:hypothetical protein
VHAGPGPLPDPAEIARLATARAAVLTRIDAACDRAGRDPADVTLVAISKTVPDVAQRVAAGSTLARTRPQAAAKIHRPGPLRHLSTAQRRRPGGLEPFDVLEAGRLVELARLTGLPGAVRASGARP